MPGSQLSTTDALVQASFLIQGTLETRAAEHGVSLIQTRLLGILRDREPTINDLATLLGLDKSSVSGLVDRAERRGLVSRRPSTTDRRSVLVVLAPEGRTLVADVVADVESDLAGLLDPLDSADRGALTVLLSRMLLANAGQRGIDRLGAP